MQTTATDMDDAVLAIAAGNMQLNASSLVGSSPARPHAPVPDDVISPSDGAVSLATAGNTAVSQEAPSHSFADEQLLDSDHQVSLPNEA